MNLSPLWISVRTALAATGITFFLGLWVAWAMTRWSSRFRGVLDSFLTLPMVLPPTVVGFLLLLIFGRHGPVGSLLYAAGYQIIFSWPATVLAASVVAFPMMYKTAGGAFAQIDPNLLHAARTLGSSEWRIFIRVMVPLAWPGIAAGAVLTFARALGEFGATLMIAGNIPGKTQTMPLAIFFAAEGGDMAQALIWVILIFLLSLTVMTLSSLWTSRMENKLRSGGGRHHGTES